MRLRSLSATAASVYESCPKRFEVEKIERAPTIAGSAALLGSACHLFSQRWVEDSYYLTTGWSDEVISELWSRCYWELFADASRWEEGHGLVTQWVARQDWENREVLSTETKKHFMLETSIGEVPVNYILDRLDRHDNGDVEVIDYKSIVMPIQPDELHTRLQSRVYALAAWLEHPEAKRVWVTFDLYRYDPVGTIFTAAECNETYRYLQLLAERIIHDDDPQEILGPECRWCMRKGICDTLNGYVASAGDELAITDVGTVAERRFNLHVAKQAVEARIKELDEMLMEHMEHADDEEVKVGDYRVSVSRSRRRSVDAKALQAILPVELFAGMAKVGPASVDDLLKSGKIDDETSSLVRRTMSWHQGSPTLNVRRRTP